ncbi:GNAT family N-acetyltransferase [Kribbella sp. NPDC051952]|uniref:GNAT family N-acetyltransferase n=1 Tax=Kribbella sp. NPDC051952 TaxID=3154851 RepID=UPI003433224D
MQPEIRPAGVEDAEAGAWCHLLCWQEAYADLVDPAKLAERTADVDRRIERWAAAAAEGRKRWIAVNPDPAAPVRDRVVGFIGIGPGRDDDRPAPVEVEAIYTRRAWWGTGLGSRLMEVAVGKQPASLWVLANNEQAKTFYRRKGFVEDGTTAAEPFFDVTEIRMVRT